MEAYALPLLFGGLAVAAVGWIWLIVRAFRQRPAWGLASLLLPPVGGLAFAARHPRQGLPPLGVVAAGFLAAASPAIFTLVVPVDLGPREKMVAGQRHVTLTGWDRNDYSVLRQKPDVVVLQMANPDVTDGVLEFLRDMRALKELDLNDTQVTDAGLSLLKDLPALTALRLARTRITDKGFREQLLHKESLMQLDLSGTDVSEEAVRSWREARSGRRALR
jgi:Leucine-rich repeat (LRR) protein